MKRTIPLSFKLILSNLCYAIPILALVYFVITAYQDNITFGEMELKGDAYQNPLEKTLQLIGQHSWLAQRAIHNDQKSKEELEKISTALDLSIQDIQKVQKLLGEDLQFTDKGLAQRQREHFKIEILKKEWEELKTQQYSLKSELSIEKHAHLIADIKGMITHLGDTSNLILDPDLDSYYLMDVTLVTIPQMQERLVDIITRGEKIIRSKSISVDDRKWLVVSSALLKQSDLDRYAGDIQTSLNEDKNFYGISKTLQGNIPPSFGASKKNVEELIKILDTLSDSTKISISADEFTKTAELAFNSSFDFWNVSVKELNNLFNFRIQAQLAKRNEALVYSVVALILAAIVSTLLGVSIRSGIVNSIKEAANRLRTTAEIIKTSNDKLLRASESLALGTSQQASAIQETVSTLYEISSMTGKSAESAQHSADQARKSQASANESKESVHELVEALTDINLTNNKMMGKVSDSNNKIEEIVSMINEIGVKTKIINEIVFQTKLLSFNASVEAARAGEHGKGFAVVAEEIGNLAAMSGNAAKEITELLAQSVLRVNGIVSETKTNLEEVVEESKQKMNHGVSVGNICESSLNDAVLNVGNVTHMINDIAIATKEQANGVSEIGKAMHLLDQTTQQNSLTADETAELSRLLDSQAEILQNAIVDLENKIGLKQAIN